MANPVKLLNHIATPKRKELDGLDDEERSNKRRSTGSASQDGEDIAIGNKTTRMLARKSISTLPKPKASMLGHIKRTGRIYDPPDSPERDTRAPPSSSRSKQKVTKSKKTRTINRQNSTQQSPLKGKQFGSIGVVPGVSMNSYNTPARPSRSKGAQKAKSAKNVVRTPPQQINPLRQLHAEVENGVEEVVEPGTLSEAAQPRTATQEEIDSARTEYDAQDISITNEPSVPSQELRSSSTGKEQIQAVELERNNELSDDDALDAEIQRQHTIRPRTIQIGKRVARKGTQEAQTRVPEEYLVQGDDDDEEPAVSPARTQRQRGRQPQTDEERRARREAQARLRIDNAEETERAQITLFEKRGRKFMDGIADVVQQAHLGSIELWSTFGAASMEITAMVERKTQMDTTRAEALSKTFRDLKVHFMEDLEPTNHNLSDCFRKLRQRAHRQHLRPSDKAQPGDQTVVNLFEQIIPQSVRLVRQHLRNRFYEQDKHSWKELWLLVKAAHDLSDIALSWRPKPSLLEAGIRGNVHKKIRPNLRQILQIIGQRLRDLEFEHRQDLLRREARKAQAIVLKYREQVHAQWEDELDQQMSLIQKSIPIRSQQASSGYQMPIDIDDIEEEDERSTAVATRALEPLLSWVEEEDIALLNGMQEHLTGDRFSLILEQYTQLQRRSIDDCIARAMYFKSRLAQAGHTFQWLQDVEDQTLR